MRKIVISHWKIIGRNFSAVRNIIKKYQIEGTVENKSVRGKKKILNAGEERFIIRQIKKI